MRLNTKAEQEGLRELKGYTATMKTDEIDEVLSRAKGLGYLGLSGDAWECLFAILWAYGNRISEVIELRTTSISVNRNEELVITFKIRKKRGGKVPVASKRLSLENPYAQIIQGYWEECKVRGGYLFARPQTKSGHIYPQYVFNYLNLLGFPQPIWPHLFRASLATELANDDVSAFELKKWFNWEKIDTADSYVSASGVSTKKITNRKW